MDRELTPLLTKGAEVATYCGLVVAIWALPTSWPIRSLLLCILVLLATLIAATLRIRTNSQALTETQSALDSLRSQLVSFDGVTEFSDGLIALMGYVSAPPAHDKIHHYSLIRERYFVDGDDATYEYELQGQRVIEGVSEELILKITGDSPVDSGRLQASAQDLESADDLPIRFVDDDPYFKVFAVSFASPVEENDKFAVKLSFRWEGTFPRSRSSDYLFSAWGFYAEQGVDRVDGLLSSDVRVAKPVLDEVRYGKRSRALTQPKLTHSRTGAGSEVTWRLEAPSTIYILRYEKQLAPV